jgi:hypothetical protein
LILVAAAGAGWAWHRAASAFEAECRRVALDTARLRARLTARRDQLRTADFHRRALEFIRSRGEIDPRGDLNWLNQYISDLAAARSVLEAWIDTGRFSDFEVENSQRPDVKLDWRAVEAVSPDRILIAAGLAIEFELGAASEGAGDRMQELDALGSWQDCLEQGSYSRADLPKMAAGLDLFRESRVRMWDRLSANLVRDAAGRIDAATDRSKEMRESPGWKHLWSRTLYTTSLLKEYGHAETILESLESLPVADRMNSPTLDALSSRLPSNVGLAGMRYWLETIIESGYNMFRLFTAIARCRADTGSYPPTLEALVPRYLPKVPDLAVFEKIPWHYDDGVFSTTDKGSTQSFKVRPPQD